jgi:hypothetical protein
VIDGRRSASTTTRLLAKLISWAPTRPRRRGRFPARSLEPPLHGLRDQPRPAGAGAAAPAFLAGDTDTRSWTGTT